MGQYYDALVAHLSDIHNLNMAYWLLQWDQNTMMPPGGAAARAAQMATLQRIRHEMLISDHTQQLLDAAEKEIGASAFESTPASMIRVARRDAEDAASLPADFVARYAQATADAFEVWKQAKANNDYAAFVPALQRILDLKFEEVSLRGHSGHPYDVFLNHWEKGLTTEQVKAIFDAQRPALVELVAAVNANQDQVDDSVLHQPFDVARQRELSLYASTAFGFDYDRWARMDVAPHPFCLQIATHDIRLTTRFDPNFFNPAFFGTLHETGHGLHGHGFAPEIDGTFLSDMDKFSHSVCESQSRTWENLVGRSRPFYEWLFPKLVEVFPDQFKNSSPEAVYKAVNKAKPQFIRVEADELTYNLHIMLRFEVELAIVEGQVRLEDAPELWNAKFQEFFGITPPDHRVGILQDIHWSMGGMGAFVGYALGNLLSVQYYNQALKAHPNIPDQIARGEFGTLHGWLVENIYQHGRKFTADELTQRVTGEGIQSNDFVAYLQTKFTDVYGL
ncbi:MAG: carboxypeptidase M32 [Anaerolineae bacterium]